jgi:hypothetical protein
VSIVELKMNGVNLKVGNILKDYLIFHVIEEKQLNQNQIMILQPNSINNFREKFSNEVLGKRTYRTPGTLRLKVMRSDQDSELLEGFGIGWALKITLMLKSFSLHVKFIHEGY